MSNKYLHVGVGGRRCPCCFPRPGSAERRAKYRAAKRREQREAWAIALDEINADKYKDDRNGDH